MAQKKTSKIQRLRRRSCLYSQRMFWKSTKCGHLYLNDGENAGSGRSCVGAHAKSLPMPSVIEVKRPAVFCGNGFLQVIRVVKVSATCGKLINWSSHQILIKVLEKVKDKPITSSVGITNSDNLVLALFAKPYPFQNPTSCMKSQLAHSLSSTIYHLSVNHYHKYL